jgi:hypothetical protein
LPPLARELAIDYLKLLEKRFTPNSNER